MTCVERSERLSLATVKAIVRANTSDDIDGGQISQQLLRKTTASCAPSVAASGRAAVHSRGRT